MPKSEASSLKRRGPTRINTPREERPSYRIEMGPPTAVEELYAVEKRPRSPDAEAGDEKRPKAEGTAQPISQDTGLPPSGSIAISQDGGAAETPVEDVSPTESHADRPVLDPVDRQQGRKIPADDRFPRLAKVPLLEGEHYDLIR